MKRLVATIALMLACTQAHAGIPVIDVANLTESVQQALSAVTQIENQIQQIRQLEDQITTLKQQFESLNGLRGLANLANNPLLHDYIPQGTPQLMNDVASLGYSGLNGAAKTARDFNMVYNCGNLEGAEQLTCQAKLAMPYQQRQVFNDALGRATQRMDQINQLMVSAASAPDPKAQSETQARLQGEQAMLTHELTNVQLMQASAAAEQNVNVSKSSERASAAAAKGGDVGALFH